MEKSHSAKLSINRLDGVRNGFDLRQKSVRFYGCAVYVCVCQRGRVFRDGRAFEFPYSEIRGRRYFSVRSRRSRTVAAFY